jgi:hypothetical protein
MAYFTYDARYNGKERASNLSQNIIHAIEQIKKDESFFIEKRNHQYYESAYKVRFKNEHFVLFGIRKFPGKSFGTEEAKMDFIGTEADILKTKSRLVEMVDGLELV